MATASRSIQRTGKGQNKHSSGNYLESSCRVGVGLSARDREITSWIDRTVVTQSNKKDARPSTPPHDNYLYQGSTFMNKTYSDDGRAHLYHKMDDGQLKFAPFRKPTMASVGCYRPSGWNSQNEHQYRNENDNTTNMWNNTVKKNRELDPNIINNSNGSERIHTRASQTIRPHKSTPTLSVRTDISAYQSFFSPGSPIDPLSSLHRSQTTRLSGRHWSLMPSPLNIRQIEEPQILGASPSVYSTLTTEAFVFHNIDPNRSPLCSSHEEGNQPSSQGDVNTNEVLPPTPNHEERNTMEYQARKPHIPRNTENLHSSARIGPYITESPTTNFPLLSYPPSPNPGTKTTPLDPSNLHVWELRQLLRVRPRIPILNMSRIQRIAIWFRISGCSVEVLTISQMMEVFDTVNMQVRKDTELRVGVIENGVRAVEERARGPKSRWRCESYAQKRLEKEKVDKIVEQTGGRVV
ncbi:hypothetical protein B0J11DRAFT_586614 [Dendryphion nanum]|uniref:Uncharacterized protein n=1 Tax=Dendryphion nanum TaxID=256645 RepID=A0A9P9CY99_9PLEO|nr:hypothetical protein B0J11DRAFT_586614 [Dendryphion nanum]